jgi:hypothetical protein
MRTPEQIADEVADMIRHIYLRPTMYARHSDVERALANFHWCWAIVHESESQLRELTRELSHRECAPSGLWSRFKYDNPDATDDDALEFALTHWRSISAALGVPLDS